MFMTTKKEIGSIYRFIKWYIIFAFFISIMNYSGMYGSEISRKVESDYSMGEFINSLMDVFVSNAKAYDIIDAEMNVKPQVDLAEIGATKISNFTGSFSYSYPIEVPTGRAGLTPSLSLTYVSGAQNGWIGVGWDLTESWIERQVKFGMPDYDDNDIFIIKFMGSTMELVKESTYQYRAKNENLFLRIVKSGDSWTATDKNGTNYYFGTITVLDGGSGSFRWYLDSIEDLNGNEITFSYYEDTDYNQVYLDQIDYPVDYHVKFILDSYGRNDSWPVWNNFFSQETIELLKEIRIYHGDVSNPSNLVRAYELSYDYSLGTSRSILADIKEYGKDESFLPSTQFTVNTANNNFASPNTWQSAISVMGNDYKYKVRLGDFSGDGKMDVLYYSTSSQIMVMLSNGSDFDAPTSWYGSIAVNDWEREFWVDDFNGDGKSDVMYNDASGIYWVMISTGGSFSTPANWHAAVEKCLSDGISDYMDYLDPNHGSWVADMNSDGMADVFYRDLNGCDYMVMLSNGNGFDNPTEWYDYPGTTDDSYVTNIADYNGDGRNDLEVQCIDTSLPYAWYLYVWICYNSGSDFNEYYWVYRDWYGNCMPIMNGDFNGDSKRDLLGQSITTPQGTGVLKLEDCKTNWFNLQWEAWQDDIDVNISLENPGNYWVVDVNGDGKDDVLYRSRDDKYKAMLSNGNSFDEPTVWQYYQVAKDKILISDFTGDGFQDIMYVDASTYNVMVMKNNAQYDLVKSVTNSLGATTNVQYVPSSEWQNTYLPFKLQTVLSVTINDNVSHTATQSYTYGGGKYDVGEKEFRGFEKVVKTDEETDLVTESHYYQDAVFKGRLSWSETKDLNNKLVTSTDNSWEAFKLVNDAKYGSAFTPDDEEAISEAADYRTFAYITESAVSNYNTSGTLYSTVTTDYDEYDSFGNFALEHRQTSDGINRYTRTVYNNNTTYWILGQPANIRINTTDPGGTGTPALRETKLLYFSSYPWRLQYKNQVHWTGSTPNEYTTTYGYDPYGNLTSEQDPRGYYPIRITYDSNGMFPLLTKNAIDQTTTRTFEPDFGTVLTETDDANNLTITSSYDAFGRLDYVTYPDGSYKDYSYNVEPNNHYVTLQASGQPTLTTYYDNFGRKELEKTAATDDTIWKETQYDNAGRVSRVSLPSYDSNRYWTIYTYDPVRGYLSQQTNPDDTYKTFTKNGFTETATDENNHTKTILKDSLDRIKKVTEATGGNAQYTYDIFDNLLTVTDPLSSVTTITYDDLGRKTSMNDPYMGTWAYGYDANGNLTLQTDGKGQQTTMPNYDGLNRVLQKNYISDSRQVVYTYDEARTGYYNKGFLTTVTSSSGATTQYNYDNMGRAANEKKTISGTDYYIDQHYDLAGRMDYIIYPDSARTRYNYTYNPIGTLQEVRKNGAAYPLADFVDYNALGQVGSISYKNGAGTEYYYYQDGSYRLEDLITTDGDGAQIQNLHYTFDDVGNISTITDSQYGATHTFTYDSINRLTHGVATSSNPSRTYDQTFTYDLAGNISSKTGIGGYTVLGWQNSTKHIRPTYVNFNAAVSGVAERNIEYNQDNKPTEITYAGSTTTYLYYDGEGNRIKKVQGSSTVIYVEDIYEVRGGQSLSYIFANGQKIVTLTGSEEYYTHADHLGSTTMTTNAIGDAIEEIGYLPFGAVLFRNVYNGGTWVSAYRFTGQEYDSEYYLYNYDARLYDPVMGRFISPDTVIPDQYNPQSLNRYAYCLNNPLIYIDPSGNYWYKDNNDDWIDEVGPPEPQNAVIDAFLTNYWSYLNTSTSSFDAYNSDQLPQIGGEYFQKQYFSKIENIMTSMFQMDGYETIVGAATTALKECLYLQRLTNVEWGAAINAMNVKGVEGYSYNRPVYGTKNSVEVPLDKYSVAQVHVHPNNKEYSHIGSPTYFSPDDFASYNGHINSYPGLISYVATINGFVSEFGPTTHRNWDLNNPPKY